MQGLNNDKGKLGLYNWVRFWSGRRLQLNVNFGHKLGKDSEVVDNNLSPIWGK